jgi:predicted DCC family thiol-disulfide oxidoreductase YuxK
MTATQATLDALGLYPLTLFYDAACPVCSLEMDHLRARNRDGRLVFVDIRTPGFDAARYGVTFEAMDAQLHAQRADGQVIYGVQVLRLAYEAVGLGWLWAPVRWGPLAPAADLAYRVFARHRNTISRTAAPVIHGLRTWRAWRTERRMQACVNGACELRHPTHTGREG